VALIKSISGIRGTIGGKPGEGLSPVDVVKFTAAYGTWVINNNKSAKRIKIVVGRDARISGPMVTQLVLGTLTGLGIDVVHLGLSTTPTVEIAVTEEKAHGGIIITASHNPKQWNALKLLNEKGEFISEKDGEYVLRFAAEESYQFAEVNKLGKVTENNEYFKIHIDKILALPLVDVNAIRDRKFKVVIDCVNSTGGIVVPMLLNALGVEPLPNCFVSPTEIFSTIRNRWPKTCASCRRLLLKTTLI
jgi:phosphomannomutase